MEIFSLWGSSEHQGEPYTIRYAAPKAEYPPYEASGHFLQDGLRLGHLFGFVGGSEAHDGRAGNCVNAGKTPRKTLPYIYQSGLTGIWARRRVRNCLWSSLWSRRTLGSTGARIFLDFDIDNQPMGEAIMAVQPPRTLRVRVHGTNLLSRIVVVKNNRDWHIVENPGWDCTFELEDLAMPDQGIDWYYVRVSQSDGHMAWSSPIWIQDCR